MSNRRYNTQTRTKAMGGGMMRKGYMSGGQSKLDVNKDGKISAEDFKMLRSKKKTNKKLEQLKKMLAGQNKKKKQIKQKPGMMMMAMKGKK